jgi:hypothetical protein
MFKNTILSYPVETAQTVGCEKSITVALFLQQLVSLWLSKDLHYLKPKFFVLSGRGLCDGLITLPEESYRLWRVVVCDQETL